MLYSICWALVSQGFTHKPVATRGKTTPPGLFRHRPCLYDQNQELKERVYSHLRTLEATFWAGQSIQHWLLPLKFLVGGSVVNVALAWGICTKTNLSSPTASSAATLYWSMNLYWVLSLCSGANSRIHSHQGKGRLGHLSEPRFHLSSNLTLNIWVGRCYHEN